MSSPLRSRRFLIIAVVCRPRRRSRRRGGVLPLVRGGTCPARTRRSTTSTSRRFEVGLAVLDTGGPGRMRAASDPADQPCRSSTAVDIIPEEPAGWADRGLMYLRRHQAAEAATDFAKAHELAPDERRGRSAARLARPGAGRSTPTPSVISARPFRPAREPVATSYALADARLKQGGPDADAEYQRLIEDGLKIDPNNLFLLREAHGHGRPPRRLRRRAEDAIARLQEFAPDWDEEGREALAALTEVCCNEERAVARRGAGRLPSPWSTRSPFNPDTQRWLAAASPPAGLLGEPVEQFLRLAPMPVRVAAPTWALPSRPDLSPGRGPRRRRCDLGGLADRRGLSTDGLRRGRRAAPPGRRRRTPLAFLAARRRRRPRRSAVVAADFDNDFRTDLLWPAPAASASGGREMTARSATSRRRRACPPNVLGGDYFGAWAADVDMDGDLDFIVAPRDRFAVRAAEQRRRHVQGDEGRVPGVADVRDFAWADFDRRRDGGRRFPRRARGS